LSAVVPGVSNVALSTGADFGMSTLSKSWILTKAGVPTPGVPPVPSPFDYQLVIQVTSVIQIDGRSFRMAFVDEPTKMRSKPAVVRDVPHLQKVPKSKTPNGNDGPAIMRENGRIVLNRGVTYAGWKPEDSGERKEWKPSVDRGELPQPASPVYP